MAKLGRPSKYKTEYNEQVIALMKEGASIEELALELGVNKTTLYEWMKKSEDFSNAIQDGKSFSEGWWHKQGRLNVFSNKDYQFNAQLFYMNMKNRFGWADKQEQVIDQTTKNIPASESELDEALTKLQEEKTKYS